MHPIDVFLPAQANAEHRDNADNARLLLRLMVAGMALWLLLFCYHLLILKVSGGLLVAEIAMTAALVTVPFVLRSSGSTRLAAALLVTLALAAVAVLSVLNGGFAFHVLIWALLAPAAIPIRWRGFTTLAISACVALYGSLFALALMDRLPAPLLEHSAIGKLVVDAASLVFLGVLLVVISRANSGVTYSHVAERDRFQRALLHSQKLGALGHLSDALVNDFNNVLMSMDYARYLLREVVPESDPRNEEIGHLSFAMDRATALSRRLESFGVDPSGGESVDEPASICVDDSLAELEKVARRLTSCDVGVSFDLASSNAGVAIEPSQLDEIVVNLIVNANDAIEGKGSIAISTTRLPHAVEIAVEDTGSGIPDEILEQLFEPFFTTKAPGSGTGLGLWSALQAARAAGGELVAESVLGRGTTMRLTLPLAGQGTVSLNPIASVAPAREFPTVGPTAAAKPRSKLSRFVDYFAASAVEPRARLWGAALASLAFAGSVAWILFALHTWLGVNQPGLARVMVVVGIANALAPLLLRLSRSVSLTMVALMLVELAGLGMLGVARGGFPLPILIFVLVIPLVANMQKEYRLLVPLTASVCLLYLGVFFTLSVTGLGPAPSLVLTPTQQLVEDLAVLISVLFLLQLAARTGRAVDDHLVAECERFRAALLQSQKLETLGTFASSIAHDLNNVLVGLEFSTTLLDEAVERSNPARVDIDELQSACTRIRTLAKQLVRFGRNDEGQTGEVEVDATLSQLEQMIGRLLGQNVKLSFELGAGRARVSFPSKRLDQIVLNLLLNARDAMTNGGQAIVRSHATNDTVVVEVSDSGTGIPPTIQDRVFEPFFTSADRASRQGLGLWLCRGVAEDAGGTLKIANSSLRGTTLRMTLPRTLGQRHPTSNLFKGPFGIRAHRGTL